MWRNSKVFLNAQDNFQTGEYLLGDSAYPTSSVIVATFKSTPGHSLNSHKEFFNKDITPKCVVSEHCNDLLTKSSIFDLLLPFVFKMILAFQGSSIS